MRTRTIAPLLLGVLFPGTAWADRADTIHKLLQTGKDVEARDKCDKWEAATIQDDTALRDACAKAAWPIAESQDTAVAWEAYRKTWEGTDWAKNARIREAAAALRTVGSRAPEADLLVQAETYRGTPSEEGFRKLAADAAIRDATDTQEALGASVRYPDHPQLWTLVERFPAAFAKVHVDGRTVDVAFDPPVPMPDNVQVTASWVARLPDGKVEPWDDAARRYLTSKGVSAAFVDQLPRRDDGPSLPVCQAPGQPAGWGPAVEVRVGKGSLVQETGYDKGCGEDAWPVFVTVEGDRVTSISLRPDHHLDLFAPPAEGAARDVRAWIPTASGTPQLKDGAVLVQAGPVYLGWAVSGGTPWATGKGAGPAAQPLNGSLVGAPLPAGWTLQRQGGDTVAQSAALAKMPAALQTWRIRSGDVRALAPLVQRVLGLDADAASARNASAPALGPDAGWVKNPDGSVQRLPPSGAKVAGIYQLEPNDIEVGVGVLVSMGIERGRIEALDGWKSDLDNDRVPEVFLRLVVDGKGTLAVVDPLEGNSAAAISNARVFMMETERVRSDAKVADTPFTFRKGDFVYLAWTGAHVTGPTTRERFMEVVRTVGPGFVSTGFDLP